MRKFATICAVSALALGGQYAMAQTQVAPGQSPGGGNVPPGVTDTGMSAPLTDNRAASGTNQSSFTGWMGGYATKNQGRVSRKAYMDEAGRRWDVMDAKHEGLTPAQVSQIYGYPSNPSAVDMAPGRAGGSPNKGS